MMFVVFFVVLMCSGKRGRSHRQSQRSRKDKDNNLLHELPLNVPDGLNQFYPIPRENGIRNSPEILAGSIYWYPNA
jgi:hypothetical protein